MTVESNALKSKVEKILKSIPDFITKESQLKLNVIKLAAEKGDSRLLAELMKNKGMKELFFTPVLDSFVFNSSKFKEILEYGSGCNSYSKYLGKEIGLYMGDEALTERNEVVLNFPFKDCILEGGQSKEGGIDIGFEWDETKNDFTENVVKSKKNHEYIERREIFYNEVLAHDEIDNLLSPKAFCNAKLYKKNGNKKCTSFTRDVNLNRERGLPDNTITDNLIIKGNNLLALHSLKKEFAGKVKLIYIDPPYNTGNDGFKYNDNFNHSTWLTFMKNRLEIARNLLKDDGCIFVQCDDNEQAYLKVLMDSIFGRDNFVTCFIWEKTQHFGKQKINYYSNKEYVICFAKQLRVGDGTIKRLLIENIQTEFEDAPLYNESNNKQILEFKKGACEFNIEDGVYTESEDPDKYELLDNVVVKNGKNKNMFRMAFKSRWTNDTLQEALAEGGTILIKSKKFSPRIIYGGNKISIVSPKTIIFTNGNNPLCSEYKNIKVGTTENGSTELRNLFSCKVFDYPKPESFLSYIVGISTQVSDIVLDFCLGSGTTAAVAHKMNRQYIGVEQMDYIETIAVERLKKVIEGEQGGISKQVDWQEGGSFIYLELAEKNEEAVRLISSCKNLDELISLFDILTKKYFLHYNVSINKFREEICEKAEFKLLPLEKQKEMFIRILDLNQLYINADDRYDENTGLKKEDIAITENFYQL